MPTQEERLSVLEQFVSKYGKDIDDLNHNVTILLGVTAEQGRDIRALKAGLSALSERVAAFEQKVDRRFEAVDSRFDAQGKKLDQILALLHSVIPQSEQGK